MSEGGVSPVPHEARPYQGRTAGLVTRGLANAVDAVVVSVALVAGYAALNGLRFLANPRGFAFTGASAPLSTTAALVGMVLYFTVAWTTTGRTYGCHVMGLRVVSGAGSRLSFAPALARAVLSVVFPVGLLWCAVSRDRRSVQDLLVRSLVVYEWLPSHGQEQLDPITRGG